MLTSCWWLRRQTCTGLAQIPLLVKSVGGFSVDPELLRRCLSAGILAGVLIGVFVDIPVLKPCPIAQTIRNTEMLKNGSGSSLPTLPRLFAAPLYPSFGIMGTSNSLPPFSLPPPPCRRSNHSCQVLPTDGRHTASSSSMSAPSNPLE